MLKSDWNNNATEAKAKNANLYLFFVPFIKFSWSGAKRSDGWIGEAVRKKGYEQATWKWSEEFHIDFCEHLNFY